VTRQLRDERLENEFEIHGPLVVRISRRKLGQSA
jgi:hypothetical protein